MMAELCGKSTGYCKGKGGSMHIADRDKGILGANGIVGAGHDIALGAGLSAQYRGTDQVCVCFFGDASTNQGTFHGRILVHLSPGDIHPSCRYHRNEGSADKTQGWFKGKGHQADLQSRPHGGPG